MSAGPYKSHLWPSKTALCTLLGPCVPQHGPCLFYMGLGYPTWGVPEPFGAPGEVLEALKPRKTRCFYSVLYTCALVAQQRPGSRPEGPKRPPGAVQEALCRARSARRRDPQNCPVNKACPNLQPAPPRPCPTLHVDLVRRRTAGQEVLIHICTDRRQIDLAGLDFRESAVISDRPQNVGPAVQIALGGVHICLFGGLFSNASTTVRSFLLFWMIWVFLGPFLDPKK